MRIVFCSDDFDSRSVDRNFENEYRAAESAGFPISLVDFNSIRRMDTDEAFRRLKSPSMLEPAIYRGWMLNKEEYDFLYSSLYDKKIQLVTSSKEYLHCHWLPNSYSLIRQATPRTTWIPIPLCFDLQAVLDAAHSFNGAPLFIKDYVKSRKHEWYEACFIPDSLDDTAVLRVTKRFFDLQDDDLQGGLVMREFVDLEPIGRHPQSGMPLTLEYRLFVYEGEVISVVPYWDIAQQGDSPPIHSFQSILSAVKSPFFSCDLAQRMNGEWMIVELGDGQVAGLPKQSNASDFYRRLFNSSHFPGSQRS